MKKVKVLHNPGAGEGEISKRQLIREIESAGFKCSYSSTKPFRWENMETEEFDFFVLAGGDGTVRKLAEGVLDRKMIEKKPRIGLLPMGTANNIARTLGLAGTAKEIIKGWHEEHIKKFDVGTINGLEKPGFFLESFGYGLFPKLIQQMKKQKKNGIEESRQKLQTALAILRDLISESSARSCNLEINGKDYSAEFLLIEVMNIRSIGPNLSLAPDADPGDGKFDVVLITEEQRDALAVYVQKKIDGEEALFDFPVVKASDLKIFWEGKHLHVDDEYYNLEKPVTVSIELREGLLEFLMPGNSTPP